MTQRHLGRLLSPIAVLSFPRVFATTGGKSVLPCWRGLGPTSRSQLLAAPFHRSCPPSLARTRSPSSLAHSLPRRLLRLLLGLVSAIGRRSVRQRSLPKHAQIIPRRTTSASSTISRSSSVPATTVAKWGTSRSTASSPRERARGRARTRTRVGPEGPRASPEVGLLRAR